MHSIPGLNGAMQDAGEGPVRQAMEITGLSELLAR
jgi:hypothetical protein